MTRSRIPPNRGKRPLRLLQTNHLAQILALRELCLTQMSDSDYGRETLQQWRRRPPTSAYRRLMTLHCFWGYWDGEELLGMAGLNPRQQELVALYVNPYVRGQGLARHLIDQVERTACTYLLPELRVRALIPALGMYQHLGYRTVNKASGLSTTRRAEEEDGLPLYQLIKRPLRRRWTHFQRRVAHLARELAVPSDYPLRHALPVQTEPEQLTSIGEDIYQRPQSLLPAAAQAWHQMERTALREGVTLQLVSAYRSVDYQTSLIRKKQQRGLSTEEIYRVSAAPGFSEHHSGRALDLSTPGCTVLEEDFARTPAYRWLRRRAVEFGFSESYPRENIHQICWEPWHWAWYGDL